MNPSALSTENDTKGCLGHNYCLKSAEADKDANGVHAQLNKRNKRRLTFRSNSPGT